MSETDDQTPRRPPTIELAATEVDSAAEKPAPGETDAGSSGATENATAGSSAAASAASGRHFTSHIASALTGAAVVAGAAAALWFIGVIPSRQSAPVERASPEMSAPAAPSNPTPNPPPPPAAAQNTPSAPDLTARLDKLERAVEAQNGDPALGSRIAEVAAQSLAALTRRVDELVATSRSAAQQADAAVKTAETARSASEAASKDQVHHEDLDALSSRIMALESAVKGLAAATAPLASAGANDRSARLTIAAEALRAAIERGGPYQAELNAVQALGIDAKKTEALEPLAASGVPSAAILARELAALIPALQEASEPRSGDTNFLRRLERNAQKLVRITPLDAPPGNDPQAVIDRVRLDAAQADIAAARADIDALPDAAKSLAEAWSKKAATREAALAASRQIAAEALAALGQSSAR